MPPLSDYIGIPYAPRGRSVDTGLDCWGLVLLFYRQQYARALPDYHHRPADRLPQLGEFIHGELSAQWRPVVAPALGDLVILNVLGRPFHVGIWVPGNRMLHTLDEHGSVIERLDQPKWAQRIEGFYRYV